MLSPGLSELSLLPARTIRSHAIPSLWLSSHRSHSIHEKKITKSITSAQLDFKSQLTVLRDLRGPHLPCGFAPLRKVVPPKLGLLVTAALF
jgi:hypothetical protein